jgi:hypothetical protein
MAAACGQEAGVLGSQGLQKRWAQGVPAGGTQQQQKQGTGSSNVLSALHIAETQSYTVQLQ